jgi:hypothetical protein
MAWNDVDERCPTCNQVTKKAKGLNRQNLRRLLKPLPQTESEWTILICMILIILVMFVYKEDTKTCREYAEQYEQQWLNLTGGNYNWFSSNVSSPLKLNLDFNIKNDTRE